MNGQLHKHLRLSLLWLTALYTVCSDHLRSIYTKCLANTKDPEAVDAIRSTTWYASIICLRFAWTATALNKGTQQGWVVDRSLTRSPWMLIHPIAKVVAFLAIMMARWIWWKGCDTYFFSTCQGHYLLISVVEQLGLAWAHLSPWAIGGVLYPSNLKGFGEFLGGSWSWGRARPSLCLPGRRVAACSGQHWPQWQLAPAQTGPHE